MVFKYQNEGFKTIIQVPLFLLCIEMKAFLGSEN